MRRIPVAVALLALASSGLAQGPGTVLSQQKISDTQGGLSAAIVYDNFGYSMVSLGDLDGDGVGDLAVGAPFDSIVGLDRGAVWILFLNSDGTVKSHQRIAEGEGSFSGPTGVLEDGDQMGSALACLGDLDGDGVVDLAVGAWHDRGAGPVNDERGAVWILFLRPNGRVKAKQKISDLDGGFTGVLETADNFGFSVGSLGDLDGDGVTDLAVGSIQDDDGGMDHGAVWILFLNVDGTVKSHQKISDTEGGFTGVLDDNDELGSSVASLGDLDGDGIGDLAVGVWRDSVPGGLGSVWILFLNADGTVRSQSLINSNNGGLGGQLLVSFGRSLAYLGDQDGDGVGDLAAGTLGDDNGGPDRGAVWVLFMNPNGTAKSFQKISDTQGGFTGGLDDEDWFGFSVAFLGDQDGDGRGDLAVGAIQDDDGGSDLGAVWMLFLDGAFHATARPRNGAGGNTSCLTNVTPPALGTTWDTQVDHAQHPGATLTILYGYMLPASGASIGAGELLVDPASLRFFRDIVVSTGTQDLHSLAVPADLALAGLGAATQALILGGAGAELCNAVDVVLGL